MYEFGGTCIDAIVKINLNYKTKNKNEYKNTIVTFLVIKEKLNPILG